MIQSPFRLSLPSAGRGSGDGAKQEYKANTYVYACIPYIQCEYLYIYIYTTGMCVVILAMAGCKRGTGRILQRPNNSQMTSCLGKWERDSWPTGEGPPSSATQSLSENRQRNGAIRSLHQHPNQRDGICGQSTGLAACLGRTDQ